MGMGEEHSTRVVGAAQCPPSSAVLPWQGQGWEQRLRGFLLMNR